MRVDFLTIPIQRVGRGRGPDHDSVAVEEPLQIQIDSTDIAVAMRTPGHDAELAAGFLFTEGILQRPEDVSDIVSSTNAAVVMLKPGVAYEMEGMARNFYLSSSCGVCGKSSIGELAASGCTSPAQDRPLVEASVILSLPETLRAHQRVFERTGGLHGAALFNAHGALELVREDVGRHNAVDKLIGRAFLDRRLPLSESILLLSGRISFELVQKALMAGIPMIAAVGAPSSLAVQTARRFGITLAGFVRNGGFNLYSGEGRVSG